MRPSVKAVISLIALGSVGAAGALGLWGSWLGLSPAQGVAFSIMLGAAVLWISELVPLFITSFAILLANIVWLAPLLENEKEAQGAFLSPFFSNIILLFLGGFVLSAALHKYLLDERLARWVLRRTGTKPSRVLLGTMIVTAVLSMWMSNTATTAMMLALALALLSKVPQSDPFRRALLLGIPFAANLGGLGTPIGTPPNAIALRYLADIGKAPTFAGWMLLAAPVLIVGLGILWQLLLRLFPAQVTEVSMGKAPKFRWSWRSRFVTAVTGVTILGWLTSDLHGLPSGTVALVPVVAFFGFRILDIPDFRSLSWDVLYIVGGGLSLGVAVSDSELSTWFVGLVPTSTLPPYALLVVVAVLAGIMTTIMSNTATANLLVPVVLGLGAAIAPPLLIVVAHACSVAMALPVSTPPNAMVFSSGELEVRDMLRPGLVISLLGLTLTCTLGYWWWGVLGIY